MIRETRLSRYPLVGDGSRPVGVIHVKSLFIASISGSITAEQLRQLARPCLELREDLPLDEALIRFQSRSEQMAVVVNPAREWTGIITIEDVLEELVGRIGDEFDLERGGQMVQLADALTPGRVLFGLRARSMAEAIQNIVSGIPASELPAQPQAIAKAVLDRELTMPTYFGKGLAVPHARLEGLERPMLALARFDEGVPQKNGSERAELVFLLLTPTRMARIQPRLLADIVRLFEVTNHTAVHAQPWQIPSCAPRP